MFLIKLKNEYGNSLNWVLPYPGDWHILKNILPIFVKIYFEAGLKEVQYCFLTVSWIIKNSNRNKV
jgi:hypothetical protein